MRVEEGAWGCNACTHRVATPCVLRASNTALTDAFLERKLTKRSMRVSVRRNSRMTRPRRVV